MKELERNIDHIKESIQKKNLLGLDAYCSSLFDPTLKDPMKGKQTLNWLKKNGDELDNKIEALKAINGIGVEEENPNIEEQYEMSKDKTCELEHQVEVFLNHPDCNYYSLSEEEMNFNGISIEILDLTEKMYPSFELMIRDSISDSSVTFRLGIDHEEAFTMFEEEIQDMLFEAFLIFSVC